ncbi:UNVERIFIED_CONTAM: Slc10a6 [Trichonephila clavipes]
MFSFYTQLKNHIKYPTGIGIALVTQFFIKPLAAYALMRSSNIIKQHALMILVISACPGGVLSSAFAYFYDGDLSLSILITSISTFLSMGVMPINLWIYGHNFETKNLILPYRPLALHLMYTITLLITGMLLQWKFPSINSLLIKVSKYFCITFITFNTELIPLFLTKECIVKRYSAGVTLFKSEIVTP